MAQGSARPPRVAYVVSHTHWDREWYQTLGEFRVDMDRVVRAVLSDLEEGRLDHFVLDGQAILLEDYLQARPDDGSRIRALVDSGKLAVGPWYVLPDEFLVRRRSATSCWGTRWPPGWEACRRWATCRTRSATSPRFPRS